MKYLESAMLCSLTPACVASPKVRLINWTGISIYSLVMMVLFLLSIFTFPGYVNDDSLD